VQNLVSYLESGSNFGNKTKQISEKRSTVDKVTEEVEEFI
jgi:hypothetical protein